MHHLQATNAAAVHFAFNTHSTSNHQDWAKFNNYLWENIDNQIEIITVELVAGHMKSVHINLFWFTFLNALSTNWIIFHTWPWEI